jgi:uroporphyrinogen III methyltransferase/synthase
MATTPTAPFAAVYLVGAGPGDPGLLTIRATECLQRADVILYDYLVNPAVLEYASDAAERVPLGRPDLGRGLTPQQIASRMVEEARKGRTVVRLKGGDPSIFGRGADEAAALRAAGIAFEIVPGITTGLAVAAYCEIPITQQDDASAVALVAGRERDEKVESRLDYEALAAFPGTLVLYMGVGRSAEWSRALIDGGRPPDTPVAIVRWCTRASQEFTRCTLESVAEFVAARGIRPPAVFVIGDVVSRAPPQSWFAARPLFGVRVLVPGTPATSRKLRERLSALGAEPVIHPAIRVLEPANWTAVDAALGVIDTYDWVVFSSANGVDALMNRHFALGGDARHLAGVRLAAIGTGTADRLAQYHLHADLVPDEFVAESLAAALAGDAGGRRFLLVRASRGRDALAEALRRSGGAVEQIVAYRSVDVEEGDPDVARSLASDEIHWIAITSGATARSLVQLYGDALRHARVASIGPIASAALRELGLDPAAEASPHTTDGLVDAILRSHTVRADP